MKENQTRGVFTEMVERMNRKSAYDTFLSTEDIPLTSIDNIKSVSSERAAILNILTTAKQKYARIIRSQEFKDLMQEMADLETSIIQARCALVSNVKLTPVNQKRGGSETNYIVARANFYNPDNVKAEIRVYLGKAEEIGRSIEELSKDHKFMEDAEKLIVLAMKEVMDKSNATARIKKSVSAKIMVNDDGEEVNEDVQVELKKREDPRLSPFKPGEGKNPKPKGGGFIIPK